MESSKIIDEIYSNSFDIEKFAKEKINLPNRLPGRTRPLSVSFEGAGFGDEGKGLVAAREAFAFSQKYKEVVVYRWNGGSNAGHEAILPNNTSIALHQLSMGALYDGAYSIVGRGMVFNAADAISEINDITTKLGSMPGKLLIDPFVTLSLDTHRALERVINNWHLGYSGSTGRGISTTYADDILRLKLTMADLLSPDWRAKFGYHYTLVEKQLGAFGFSLKEIRVATLMDSVKGQLIGSRESFLSRLAESKSILSRFVRKDYFEFLYDKWNGRTPFVFEGAQAIGLHPKHGVYPDVTSSETRARGIQDSTEGIVDFRKIEKRFGVLKGPYMSSVGSRVMPGEFDLLTSVDIREKFGEYGATTGRPRGIVPPDMPALVYWRNVSDYDYLVVTHMDTGLPTIPVVVGYVDAKGKEVTYRPYQKYLDKIYPRIVDLPGWDSEVVKKAKAPKEFPENALKFLAYLAKALNVEIAVAGTGSGMNDFVTWLRN